MLGKEINVSCVPAKGLGKPLRSIARGRAILAKRIVRGRSRGSKRETPINIYCRYLSRGMTRRILAFLWVQLSRLVVRSPFAGARLNPPQSLQLGLAARSQR